MADLPSLPRLHCYFLFLSRSRIERETGEGKIKKNKENFFRRPHNEHQRQPINTQAQAHAHAHNRRWCLSRIASSLVCLFVRLALLVVVVVVFVVVVVVVTCQIDSLKRRPILLESTRIVDLGNFIYLINHFDWISFV